MILFKDDWAKYPEAIIDLQTSNKTFIRLAGLYKSMGIDNAEFCLALHDTTLIGVDPYSKELTTEQKQRIAIECKINPWYFFREVVRVPAVAGPDNKPLRANRLNISLFWLFFNHITTMAIAPRQTGKSISTDSLMIYLFALGTLNTDINLLTKDDNLRMKNIQRLKDLRDGLPPYLNLKSRSDTNNTEKLTMSALGNTYHSNVGQPSDKAALNLGRGMTIPINQVDEIAFIRNIQITLPAMLAATGAARDAAQEAGAPYGNIFTTTPGYLSSESGKFAYSIYSTSFRWTEKLFDCKDLPELKDTIIKNTPGKNYRVLLEYNHRQLGFTDEWLRGKIQDAMSSGEDAGADFLNLWAEGSEVSPIPKNLLKIIKASIVKEPYIEISKYGYITRWYVNESIVNNNIDNRKVVLSLDTSDAVGNDDIGMVLRDASTGEVLAVGVYNETNLITFSEWIAYLIQRFNNMTVIIERRSSGVAIIDNLLKILPTMGIDPFRRLFNWVVNDADVTPRFKDEVTEVPMARRDLNVYTKYRKEFGYATSGSGRAARDNLYGTAFMPSIKYTGSNVRDRTLIDQISGLTRRNDRIDHAVGEHDDLVIAWLLGYWFLLEAKYKQFYGLHNSVVLSNVIMTMIDEQGGQEAVDNKNRQLKIKAELDFMLDQLRNERNPMKVFVLQNRIKHRYKDIDTSIIQSFNIDSLLENIMLEKKRGIHSR